MALSDQSQNPLLGKWETQHEIAPFNVIYDEHFQPALEIACSEALLEVEDIIKIEMNRLLRILLKPFFQQVNCWIGLYLLFIL